MDFQDTPHPEAGGPAAPMPPVGPPGIGAVLRQTRIAQGLSLFVLAHELNLSVAILEAVEAEAWNRLPQGRERPHIRQIAERLGVDLASFPQQWSQVPGAPEQEAPDPRREALERVLVSAITVGSLGLLLWLVVPGPSLKRAPRAEAVPAAAAGPAPWAPKAPAGPYPVVGEVLPEVPVNEEGVLVTMRAMDSCQAVVQALGGDPMAAAATAGVVALEVAGHRIRPGRTVGEPWLGKFGPTGEYLVPVEEGPRNPPTAPETDPSPLDAAPNDSEGE
jgi:transcriptional regulator with XRE-family HTH domain